MRGAYVSRLATAIERGETPDVTGEDGLAVQAIIEAAYRSADEGRSLEPARLIEELEG
jgi:predicted dehydrogenase